MISKDLRYFFRLTKNYKLDVLKLVVSLIGSAATVLSLGVVLKNVVAYSDNSITAQGGQFYFGVLGLCFLLSFFIYMRSKSIAVISENVEFDVKQLLIEKLLFFKQDYFANKSTSAVQQEIVENLSNIKSSISTYYSFFIRNTILVIGGFFLLFYSSWKLSLILFACLPFVILPAIYLAKRLRVLRKEIADKKLDNYSYIEEILDALNIIQPYAKQDEIIKQNQSQIDNLKTFIRKKNSTKSLIVATIIFLISVLVISVTYFGVIEVSYGNLKEEQLISFIYYAIVVASSLAGMSEVLTEISKGNSSAKFLKSILGKEINLEKKNSVKEESIFCRFDQVSFSNKSKTILNKISFEILFGDKIAIIGASGSGKTSILNLMLGLYEKYEGNLYVAKSKIACVPQNSKIFQGSIKDNLLFANSDASHELMIHYLKKVNLFEEIYQKQKDVLDYKIKSGGKNLSHGQKQRLAIARALISNPEVMIIDEVTAGLDLNNEKIIISSLEEEMRDKTVIYVTHNLLHIKDSHKVLLMNEGKITAFDTHENLIKKKGLYYQLYKNHLFL